jgi:hypothetical protein
LTFECRNITGVVANLIANIETKMGQGAQAQGSRELAAAF